MAQQSYTFTNGDLFAERPGASFVFALMGQFNNLVLPPRLAYESGQNYGELKRLQADYAETRKKIIGERCQKDEQGNPVTENNRYQFPSMAAQRETDALLKELDEVPVSVSLHPLRLSQLHWPDGKPVDGITGHMMAAFAPFIVNDTE